MPRLSDAWALDLALGPSVRQCDLERLMRFIATTQSGVPVRMETETDGEYRHRVYRFVCKEKRR